MTIAELINELGYFDESATAEVEINGQVFPIEAVTEDSQGVYVQVTTTEFLEFRK